MPIPHQDHDTAPGWGKILTVAAAILLARIVYLVWLCPYDLAADEAQYWDWSRRLDWSYYSKGPAVAWLIAPSVKAFGITEWAVRLPAAIAAFVCMIILALFAVSASNGDRRAGWYAMLSFALLPVFSATSQFMTIDGPFYACWLMAAYAGWIMVKNGHWSPGWFFLLGSLLGIGMLCKYTILLLLPGILAYFLRQGQLPRGRRIAGLTALFTGFILFSFPIYLWNHQHGWPTIAHLIGATRLPGGDIAPDADWRYNPLWTLSYPFYAFALLAPPATLLLLKTIKTAYGSPEKAALYQPITRYALYTSAPILFFYLLVSSRADIKLNWPAAGFTVPLVPLACFLARQSGHDPAVRRLWRWTVGVGLVCIAGVAFAVYPIRAIGKITFKGESINTGRLLKRISGFPQFARNIEIAAGELKKDTHQDPFYVSSTYAGAALLAFYMTGHPVVYSADSYQGGRESSYDYFPDTDLADPRLIGRPAILFDHDQWVWERALYFRSIERTRFAGNVYRGYEYRGPWREPHMK